MSAVLMAPQRLTPLPRPALQSDRSRGVALAGLWVALLTGGWAFVPGFQTLGSMGNLAVAAAMIGWVGAAVSLGMLVRGPDLSVGASVSLGGIVLALVWQATASPGLAILAGMGVGVVMGLINGLLVARWKLHAMLATLLTLQLGRGLGQLASPPQGVPLPLPEGWYWQPDAAWTGALALLVMMMVLGLLGLLLRYTVFGRNALAAGGNPWAAHLAGIQVGHLRIVCFVISGVMAAAAGILLALSAEVGHPNAAAGLEMHVLAACLLGGASLRGGRVNPAGLLLGALMMGTLQQIMTLLQCSAVAQTLVLVACVLLSALSDPLRRVPMHTRF
jgi:L-arabinose transport system permease protein